MAAFEILAKDLYREAVALRFCGRDPLELASGKAAEKISERLRDLINGRIDEELQRVQDRVAFTAGEDPGTEADKERLLDVLEDLKGEAETDRAEAVEDMETLLYLLKEGGAENERV